MERDKVLDRQMDLWYDCYFDQRMKSAYRRHVINKQEVYDILRRYIKLINLVHKGG